MQRIPNGIPRESLQRVRFQGGFSHCHRSPPPKCPPFLRPRGAGQWCSTPRRACSSAQGRWRPPQTHDSWRFTPRSCSGAPLSQSCCSLASNQRSPKRTVMASTLGGDRRHRGRREKGCGKLKDDSIPQTNYIKIIISSAFAHHPHLSPIQHQLHHQHLQLWPFRGPNAGARAQRLQPRS